jgi:hypothetical protein
LHHKTANNLIALRLQHAEKLQKWKASSSKMLLDALQANGSCCKKIIRED